MHERNGMAVAALVSTVVGSVKKLPLIFITIRRANTTSDVDAEPHATDGETESPSYGRRTMPKKI